MSAVAHSTTPSGFGEALTLVQPIDLVELDRVAALRSRIDRKYLVPAPVAVDLIAAFADSNRALEIDEQRSFNYQSTYFDTPDLASFRGAAHGHRRRFKVRTRVYGSHQSCVLEVKTKGRGGHTMKSRLDYDIESRHELTADGVTHVAIATGDAHVGNRLRPVLHTSYVRSTVVDPSRASRTTFDRSLIIAGCESDSRELDNRVIIETKSVGAPTLHDAWLWSHGWRPQRISKFCVGFALINPHLPANRWHRVITELATEHRSAQRTGARP